MSWTYAVNDINGEEVFGTFTKKNFKNQIQKKFKLKNQSREKLINYMLNGKDTMNCLIAGYIKKSEYYKWGNIFQNQNL